MKCKYSLTFEFNQRAPITVKGEIEAEKVRTIFARAVDNAIVSNAGIRWRSMVVVIERLDLGVGEME